MFGIFISFINILKLNVKKPTPGGWLFYSYTEVNTKSLGFFFKSTT